MLIYAEMIYWKTASREEKRDLHHVVVSSKEAGSLNLFFRQLMANEMPFLCKPRSLQKWNFKSTTMCSNSSQKKDAEVMQ